LPIGVAVMAFVADQARAYRSAVAAAAIVWLLFSLGMLVKWCEGGIVAACATTRLGSQSGRAPGGIGDQHANDGRVGSSRSPQIFNESAIDWFQWDGDTNADAERRVSLGT